MPFNTNGGSKMAKESWELWHDDIQRQYELEEAYDELEEDDPDIEWKLEQNRMVNAVINILREAK
jgi:hypothetical protein